MKLIVTLMSLTFFSATVFAQAVNTYFVIPERVQCSSADIQMSLQSREIGDSSGVFEVSISLSYKGVQATVENRGLEKTKEVLFLGSILSGVAGSGRMSFSFSGPRESLSYSGTAFNEFTSFSRLQQAGPIKFPAKLNFFQLESGFRRMVHTDRHFDVNCVASRFLSKCVVDPESWDQSFCRN